ncbi:MAG: type II toxin-antitoxin system HicA family toxin [Candidatus Diapherotrites archaeon]|nr:type II toxin-antitoxin system HicA family toxin [Candidatus Diapherotrites archaeon]
MPKIPVLSGKQVVKALEKAGFKFVKQKGSHVKLRKVDSEGKKTVIVPLKPLIRIGTMKSILRQARLDIEELLKFLK